MTIASTRAALIAALRTVEGLRVYEDPGATIDPPGAVVGLPELKFEAYSTSTPTDINFQVYLMVAADDRAEANLIALMDDGAVVDAIWAETDFAVTDCVPGSYTTSGGTDLPCYVLTVVS